MVVVQRAQICSAESLACAMVGLQPGISVAGEIYIMTDLCSGFCCLFVVVVFCFFLIRNTS